MRYLILYWIFLQFYYNALYRWLHPLFKIAKKRQLQPTDMFPLLQEDSCERQIELFKRL